MPGTDQRDDDGDRRGNAVARLTPRILERRADNPPEALDSAERVATPGRTGDVGTLLRRGAKSALARWVIAQQRRRRDPERDHPTPRDEATHAWDGRRRFAEDYTFCAVQPGLALIARLEWLAGRDANRVWLTILREDGVLALPGGQRVLRSTSTDRWRAGGMVLDCLVPLSRWTMRYSGEVYALPPGGPGPRDPSFDPGASASVQGGIGQRCSVDLTFVGSAPPYTPGTDDDPDLQAKRLGQAQWDRRLLQAVRKVTNRGYVQLGSMVGTIAVGDELIPVRASALRQHFWGVRDWGASDLGFQCFAVRPRIPDGANGTREADRRDPAITWIHHARFPLVTMEGGFTSQDRGAVSPISGLDVTWEQRPERAPAHTTLVVSDPHGDNRVRPQRLELATCSDCAFLVDGRGLASLALARVGGDQPGLGTGWALWGGQQRWLPRR